MRSSLVLAVLLSACVPDADADNTTPDPAPGAAESPAADVAPPATTEIGHDWSNQSIPQQKGTFHVVFALVPDEPSGAPIDAVVGLSDGSATDFADLGPTVRFSSAGTLDVRNGSAYESDVAVQYRTGQTYQIWMDIDVTRHRYSVLVQENGGHTTRIAANYAFPTEQSALAQVNNIARRVNSPTGSLQQIAADVTTDSP
jgi:hypothetical protein